MDNSSFSLSELNIQVREAIRDYLPDAYWVRAETSDVRQNQNGHCYLEFIEKDSRGQNIVARARGVIWSNTYTMLKAFFMQETGQQFASGLSVLVRVSVEFHELYGYSLSVVDIDPSYTVGEIARNRQIILRQLEEEGVLTLNKELELPEIPNRVAVISSPTAAGYEDFCDQLDNNSFGFKFYHRLFPAIMQGERTEQSVVDALDKIYEYHEHFDVVVIIRGGGASSDLSSFDTYLLGASCAQFPLPIISGIGHERDVTVIDEVAHTRVKTPTAAAEFLVSVVNDSAVELLDLEGRLLEKTNLLLQNEKQRLTELSRGMIHASNLFVRDELALVQQQASLLRHAAERVVLKENHYIESRRQYIDMVSPDNILKRGYTLTLKNGSIIQSTKDLLPEDVIETLFSDGKIESVIRKTTLK